MPLEEYRKKRRFDVTPEPSGRERAKKKPKVAKKATSLGYVIQKHRASHLHYDFRLEWKGVLLSWAVPKGPSLDPSVKRLAMPTEDHPLAYASFEGIIPEGQYGGGTVMVWDEGTWTPDVDDVDAAIKKGDLKFTLHGKKLKGSWVLVRTKGWGGGKSKGSARPTWILIKHRDAHSSSELDVAEDEPRSVVSKRLLAEIAIEEGGNVETAATGDPAGEIRKLIGSPKLRARKKKAKPSVWQSNRGSS